MLSNPFGWAFCREALRQAQGWRSWARRRRRAQEVPRKACCQVLRLSLASGASWEALEAPTELLLELLEQPSGLEKPLQAELARRIQRALGEGPAVPLEAAVRLANGHTQVECAKEGLLFSGLVASVAKQLTSTRQVNHFLSYQPCPELLDAVTKLKEGSWQGLELKCGRRASKPPWKPKIRKTSSIVII